MNAKKIFVVAVALNVVLLAVATSFRGRLPWQSQDVAAASPPPALPLTGASGKFGPVMELVLPGSSGDEIEMLNLETGRLQPQESLERFDFHVDALMAWIRSEGLDLSCSVWSNGTACVTHGMITLPVEAKGWEKTTEAEIVGNLALASKSRSPRRMLMLGAGRPDTYVFRTSDGTLGMLQLAGLSETGPGVKIRYKLINPAKPVSVAM